MGRFSLLYGVLALFLAGRVAEEELLVAADRPQPLKRAVIPTA